MDKPDGPTSHDVVARVRRLFHTRAVGHTGTLDPFATGLLVLVLGSATRLARWAERHRKSYRAEIRLGVRTSTDDRTGTLLREERPERWPSAAELSDALGALIGGLRQRPPAFSAKRVDGTRSYRLARRGEVPALAEAEVMVYQLELVDYQPPLLSLSVEVGPGTYIRALARDLGERLGCGAHLADLRRTRSGPFTLDQASSPETLRVEAESGEIERRLVSPLVALGLPALRLSADEVARIAQGTEIAADGPPGVPGTQIVGHDEEGRVVAILELLPGRRLRPLRVLEPFAGRG